MHDIVVRLHPVGGRPNGARPKWAARSSAQIAQVALASWFQKCMKRQALHFFCQCIGQRLGSNVDRHTRTQPSHVCQSPSDLLTESEPRPLPHQEAEHGVAPMADGVGDARSRT